MYVMTWGDFCLMSRGRGEKIQQQTSRGSFDLGRLAPGGQWVGGHETLSNNSPLAAG